MQSHGLTASELPPPRRAVCPVLLAVMGLGKADPVLCSRDKSLLTAGSESRYILPPQQPGTQPVLGLAQRDPPEGAALPVAAGRRRATLPAGGGVVGGTAAAGTAGRAYLHRPGAAPAAAPPCPSPARPRYKRDSGGAGRSGWRREAAAALGHLRPPPPP
ncbi:regulator of cell cycle RGCC isoform X1 [Vidua chalybeata]|uniref:regulator of cell cycle RGCC isoform X1 n=1 Tax=Vidua chalybeata TaxID=81927 RepID=UPI0023A7D36E|nr:regulator of cell cycle RGCC isoform X1 [Vidua chalybeata]